MDSNRFDELTRSLANRRDRRSVLKSLGATLGAVGVFGLGGAASAQKPGKVNFCHHNETGTYDYITVSENAAPAHRRHGDVENPDFMTDAGNCGTCGHACEAVDACTPASCQGGVCNETSSCTGTQVCETGGTCGEPAAVVCTNAVLAGAGGAGTQFLVDDGLTLFVNDTAVFEDPDMNNAGYLGPIVLGSLTNGDVLRVVATDSYDPRFCGGAEHLDPITLYCLSTGTSQPLLEDTIRGSGGPCGHIFYDQTFTVAL